MTTPSPRERLRSHYNVRRSPSPSVAEQFPATDLLDPDWTGTFLRRYGDRMGSDKLHVAASRWSYHYLHPVLKGGLYARILLDRPLRWQPGNLILQRHPDAKPGYEWGVQLLDPAPPDRGEGMLRGLLEDNLEAMFACWSRVSRLPERVLWENVVHLLVGMAPRLRERVPPDRESLWNETARRLHERLRGRVPSGAARILGRAPSPRESGSSYRRTTCCLNHELARACASCPMP